MHYNATLISSVGVAFKILKQEIKCTYVRALFDSSAETK